LTEKEIKGKADSSGGRKRNGGREYKWRGGWMDIYKSIPTSLFKIK
jgi:hypothetical protein